MRLHASRKEVIEIEYQDEAGTGLGPTVEFFTLVAGEVQRKDLGMWICEDDLTPVDRELDLGSGGKLHVPPIMRIYHIKNRKTAWLLRVAF